MKVKIVNQQKLISAKYNTVEVGPLRKAMSLADESRL
jgi:hypothetical protein